MAFEEQAMRYCDAISALTGLCCTLLDVTSGTFHQQTCCHDCMWQNGRSCNAIQVHRTGCAEAQRQNGQHQYCCPRGFVFLATVLRRPRLQRDFAMVTGPVRTSARAGYGEEHVPIFTEQRIRALEETVQAVCGFLAGEQMMSAADSSIQSELLETMRLSSRTETQQSYSLENERKLQQLIRLGEKQAAQRLFNEILLDLYSSVGTDLILLKLRVRELITLMSRAATEGGAEMHAVFALCDSSIIELDRIQDFDALDAWLGVVLHKFFDMVFGFRDTKYQSIIQQAATFIQEHLAEKLTLERVATQVHISKSYLCRILKEELGCTFTEYTNHLRVERSKLYLHSSDLSLSEIACAVGFDDQSYYTRIFKREVGMPPGKYRTNSAGM